MKFIEIWKFEVHQLILYHGFKVNYRIKEIINENDTLYTLSTEYVVQSKAHNMDTYIHVVQTTFDLCGICVVEAKGIGKRHVRGENILLSCFV